MIIIKYPTTENLAKNPANTTNKKLMNIGFNANNVNASTDESTKNNYQIIDMESFLSLRYSTEIKVEGEGEDNNTTTTKTAVIKTPLTRKIVTDVYQYYQLIGDLYFNTTFDKIKEPLDKQFQYFEDYYLSITNQPIQITSMLFKNVKDKENKAITGIQFYNPDVTQEPVKDRLKTVLLLYIAFYYFVAPFMNPYHDYIRKHLKLSGSGKIHEETLKYILYRKNLKTQYNYFLQDLILQLCGEGSMEPLYKYHYTELDKEVYLLKQLDKEYISCSSNNYDKNNNNYETMINILNKNLKYYKDNNLNKIIKDKLYTNESKAIALEYITKLDLINAHESRMYLYKEFETALITLINNPAIETEFNSYMDMIFGEYLKDTSDINTTSNNFVAMFETIRVSGLI